MIAVIRIEWKSKFNTLMVRSHSLLCFSKVCLHNSYSKNQVKSGPVLSSVATTPLYLIEVQQYYKSMPGTYCSWYINCTNSKDLDCLFIRTLYLDRHSKNYTAAALSIHVKEGSPQLLRQPKTHSNASSGQSTMCPLCFACREETLLSAKSMRLVACAIPLSE